MLREEFSRKHVALKFHRVDVFCTAQWRWHRLVFIIYRLVMPAYTIFAFTQLVVETHPGIRLLAFLTIWTYLVEMLFFLTGAALAFLHCLYPRCFRCNPAREGSSDRGRRENALDGGAESYGSIHMSGDSRSGDVERGEEDSERVGLREELVENASLPWFVQLHWGLGNVVQVFTPIVTVIYFGVLYPSLRDVIGDVKIYDINVHALSTVMLLVDIAVSARPVRLLHVLYPIVYGVIYVIFSVFFWAADPENNVLYPNVLDWNKPGISIGVIIALAVIGIPLLQLANFGLYRLRLKVFQKVYGEPFL